MIRQLRTAKNKTQKCDKTLLGYHVFALNIRRVHGKQVGRDYRCRCGQEPLHYNIVDEHMKTADQHDAEIRHEQPGFQGQFGE